MKNKSYILPLLFSLAPLPLFCQPVGLDQSFATNGIYYFTDGGTSEYFVDVAVQSDGKPVAVGYTNYDPDEANNYRIVVMRFNTNGTPDSTFGVNGKVYIDTPQSTDDPNAIVIQSDGKILIAGTSQVPSSSPPTTFTGGTIYRLNSNGTTDNAFGTNGRAYIIGEVTRFFNLAIQPNGRVVVSGLGFVGSQFSYLVARFNTNGQLDPTFGNGIGFVRFRSSTSSTEEDNGAGIGIALQPDGKILTCGYDEKENGTVARLNINGTLDNTFGYNGFKYWDFSRDVFLYRIAVQNDGKIVIAGTYDYSSTENRAVLIRLFPNGNDDSSFNSGISFNFYGNLSSVCYDMEIQSDGKYVLGGLNDLFRVNTNAIIDNTFDGDGFYTLPLATTYFYNLKLHGNKIYVVGDQYTNGDYNGFIARISNNFTTTPALEASTMLSAALYPNPATDILQVKLPEAMVALLNVYDLSGQLLYSAQLSGSTDARVSVADWPKGMYFMRITQEETGQQRSFPFVVQH